MRISDWSSDVCSSDLNARDPDFLFNDLRARLAHEPQRWHLVVTLAAPGDRTDNATVRWPETRERIDVGTLVIERAVPESSGPCRDVTFDPLVLPPGIAASDDPLLSARSAVYAASLRRRSGEGIGRASGRERGGQYV